MDLAASRNNKNLTRTRSPQRKAQLEKRLLAYALGAAGITTLTQPANASIVFTKTNFTLTHGSLNIDLNHDGVTDFVLKNYSTGSSSLYVQKLTVRGGSDASAKVIGQTQFTRLYAWAAPLNWSIGPNSPKPFVNVKGAPALMAYGLCTFYCNPRGPFGRATDKFLALQFAINGEIHYGWARLSARLQGNLITAILTGYAYETTPNKAILAGDRGPGAEKADVEAVPDRPGPSLAMLSLGAPGLDLWRREMGR
jgi:hypothetical protein